MRHREEVAVDEAAAPIMRQVLAQRKRALLVPFGDLGLRIDHDQRSHVGPPGAEMPAAAQAEQADQSSKQIQLSEYTRISPTLTATRTVHEMATGLPRAQSQEVHRRALAKAGR